MDRRAAWVLASVYVSLVLFTSNSLGNTSPDRGVFPRPPANDPVTLLDSAPPAAPPESPGRSLPLFSWVSLLFGEPGPKQSTGLTASLPAGAPVLTALESHKLDLARQACAKAGPPAGQVRLDRRLLESEKAEAVSSPKVVEFRPDSAALLGVSIPPRQEFGPPGLSEAEREKLTKSPASDRQEVKQ
jgi:hypothetical protein